MYNIHSYSDVHLLFSISVLTCCGDVHSTASCVVLKMYKIPSVIKSPTLRTLEYGEVEE